MSLQESAPDELRGRRLALRLGTGFEPLSAQGLRDGSVSVLEYTVLGIRRL